MPKQTSSSSAAATPAAPAAATTTPAPQPVAAAAAPAKAPRKQKAAAAATEAAAAPAPVAVAAPAPAPVAAPAPAPVVEAAPATNVVVEAAPESTEVSFADRHRALVADLATVRKLVSSLTASLNALGVQHERLMKQAMKKVRKAPSGNKKANGFAKPVLISTELATFLGRPEGVEMSRNEVTNEITRYVKERNLQNPMKKREIRADEPLLKLLRLTPADRLEFFNLQRFLTPHFPPSAKAKAAAAAAAAAAATKEA